MAVKEYKLGIMGGTFDPIHFGHLKIVEQAVKEFGLDRILFIPTGHSPHKDFSSITSPQQRLRMTELAIDGVAAYQVSRMEIKHPDTSYTYRTLEILTEKYPEAELYFILGADSLSDFHTWKEPGKILAKAVILASVRDDHDEEKMQELIKTLTAAYGGQIFLLHSPKMDVSSREIRGMAANGKSIDTYVPKPVADYIREHDLYKRGLGMDIEKIKKQLKKDLKKSRYEHTIGVMETAVALAEHYGCDVKKARYAGLLHDCAKHMGDQEKIDLCLKYGVTINETEYANPALLHAKAGAILAREQYGVTDDEILHAIAVHTTGCVAMNLLDKIVYIADYIEPNRDKAPNLSYLRKLAMLNLDETMYRILKDTVEFLSTRTASRDPQTVEAFEYYRNLMREKAKLFDEYKDLIQKGE